MKVFIAFLAIIAVVCADDWVPKNAEEVKAIRAECLSENPLPSDVLDKIKKLEYEDTEAVHKYLLCSVKKLGIFCEHEGYHPERVLKQFNLDEAEFLEIVKGCLDKNEQKSSVEVWAYRGNQCILSSKAGAAFKEHVKAITAEKKE